MPAHEPGAKGLRFLTTDQYLLEFGWRGRLRMVWEGLRQGDVEEAWLWAWRRAKPRPRLHEK